MNTNWLQILITTIVEKIEALKVSTVQRFSNDTDKVNFELEIGKLKIEIQKLQFENENIRISELETVKKLYKTKPSIQGTYALTFLIGYIILTFGLVIMIMNWFGVSKIEIPEWGVALISTLFTAMSTKVSTITDFFFGSSKSSNDKNETINQMLSESK